MKMMMESALHVTDLLGRSFLLELKSGEQLHFRAISLEFDELIGLDDEMMCRTLLVSDINTASRKEKVYSKLIVDMIAL